MFSLWDEVAYRSSTPDGYFFADDGSIYESSLATNNFTSSYRGDQIAVRCFRDST